MQRKFMESVPNMLIIIVACTMILVMLPEASATRWTVGGNMGWNTNFNYTTWSKGKHFYKDDWLFFVYDRNQMNVLEVNKTNYESCNSDHPLHNWTTGAGRDVVPLNVTRNYYFISGKGFCYGGMKIAIHVEKLPPPPKASPIISEATTTTIISSTTQIILLPIVFAIGATFDAFINLW
ncbi:PREDICTED: lamin-like protein [Lupinus angustifolius]|uniref:lamin-like protein n=1 Tax=Lupinus angustifolius TaxID=3871 RepID=UPI00092E2564|nr:PREDICTED: lamin-like protein [Lupinus angustifolius]